MILGIGTDIVKIERIAEVLSKRPKFLQRNFSEDERIYLSSKSNNPINVAGFFAAKEAAVKAAGGVISNYTISHDEDGKPLIVSDKNIHISISHEQEYAIAFAIYQTEH